MDRERSRADEAKRKLMISPIRKDNVIQQPLVPKQPILRLLQPCILLLLLLLSCFIQLSISNNPHCEPSSCSRPPDNPRQIIAIRSPQPRHFFRRKSNVASIPGDPSPLVIWKRTHTDGCLSVDGLNAWRCGLSWPH